MVWVVVWMARISISGTTLSGPGHRRAGGVRNGPRPGAAGAPEANIAGLPRRRSDSRLTDGDVVKLPFQTLASGNSAVGMTVAVTVVQPRGIYEPAAIRWDFAHWDSAAVCAGSTAERCKVEGGCTKVVSVISGDKAKTQAYCQIAKISQQVDQTAREKDRKKAEELVQKINELEKQLGPEYLALVDALFNNNNMDLNSEDFEEIVSMFDRFDEACRH
jgi:hypothetical protein